MSVNSNTKPALHDVSSLYLLVGEALCMIQLLEGALSTSITLKKDVQYPNRIMKEEADNFLKKYHSFTLGRAIELVEQYDLYYYTLYSDLKALKEERNWLVHKFLHHHLDDMHVDAARENLFHKIKNISNRARMLQEVIEADWVTKM